MYLVYSSFGPIPGVYVWYITWLAGYVTGTEQTHKVFSRYNPGIGPKLEYTRYILSIFMAYDK